MANKDKTGGIDKGLHKEVRDKLIGCKVSESEHEVIEKFCEAKGTNISMLMRYAIFKMIDDINQ